MTWTRSALKDYMNADGAPDWLIEERERQRDFQRELRKRKADAARSRCLSLLVTLLVGPGPWKFADLYAAWKHERDQLEDGLHNHVLYRSRWLEGLLVGRGFKVTGKRKRGRGVPVMEPHTRADGSIGLVPKRDARGDVVRRDDFVEGIDSRIVERVVPLVEI